MKNIYEVLRQKEQQSEQLEKEIEALRLTIKILDASEATAASPKSELRASGIDVANEVISVASGNTTKRFP